MEEKGCLTLTEKELRALGRILLRQWIDHEDDEAQFIVSKIFRKINDMDRLLSQTD